MCKIHHIRRMVGGLLLVKLPGKLFWKKKFSYRASGLKRIFPLSLIRGNLKMTMRLLRTSIPHIYRLSKHIGSIWNPNHDLERRYGKSSKAKEKGRENCLKFATFRERGRDWCYASVVYRCSTSFHNIRYGIVSSLKRRESSALGFLSRMYLHFYYPNDR